MRRKSLDIVSSALNEEECLPEFVSRLELVMNLHPNYDWRLIICDNGSSDGTWDLIRRLALEDSRILGIKMARTFQLDAAFTCGLDLAVADAVVIMASDLQDPPEVIHEFLNKYEEGFDQVVAKVIRRDNVPFVRRVLSNYFYTFSNRMTNGLIPKGVSDFRLLNRAAYSAARSLREKNRFLRGLIAWTGFNTAVVEIERPQRFAGDSKFVSLKITKVVQWALGSILSHTAAPLIWISVLGVFGSALSFLTILVCSVLWFWQGVPFAGFGTIIGSITLGFSLVLLSLGVIAQYVALIYEEVKGRPIYLISQRTDELFDEK
jgi:glycosyltransferase involved in cell wall biosynthesis